MDSKTVQSERTCSMHARNHRRRLKRDEENRCEAKNRNSLRLRWTHNGPNVSTPHVCESFRMDCVGLLGSYYCFRCDCVIRFRRNVAPNNHGRSSHIPQQRQPPRDAHAVSVLCVRHQEINHFTSFTNCCYVCTGERCNTRTNAVDETNEQREIKWTKRNCLFGKEISW